MRNLIGLFDAICDAYDRNDFKPNSDGSTHCNQAVQAIAAAAFTYNGFRGMNADQMMTFLVGNQDWLPIAMEQAQDQANNGSLVVAGLTSTELGQGHGHVVVIRPGLTVDSGKWGMVPRCVNIGASDFIARAQTGPITGSPVGVNDAFIPKPKFYVLRSSL
jgi:hypothetical protein